MTQQHYESWRISYQSSESAARAAWQEMTRLLHRVQELESAIKKQIERSNDLSWYMHDQITAQQAAWIEWKHGQGADEAMGWIENGLAGPGHIPDGTDPQKWFDANCADALRKQPEKQGEAA